ncbi:MAG: hypothetical protein HQL07_04925 [Nitrospirae bacterium]|nr:hypothetical protein [Magnetococcales bacterium]HAT49352.1 hypothetical protein [Alphaproteobacteria bacterium]
MKELSDHIGLFDTNEKFPSGTKCFIGVRIGDAGLFSRGFVSHNDHLGTSITLENGYRILERVIQELRYGYGSTLNNFIAVKKANLREIIKILDLPDMHRNYFEFDFSTNDCDCLAKVSCRKESFLDRECISQFCEFINGAIPKGDIMTAKTGESLFAACLACQFYEDSKKHIGNRVGGECSSKVFDVFALPSFPDIFHLIYLETRRAGWCLYL